MAQPTSVTLWMCSIGGLSDSDLAELTELVAEPERHVAARMRQSADRSAVLAAHALLRVAIGDALGVRLDEPYTRRCGRCGGTDHGKPSLPSTDVTFSISHTRGMVAVALGHASLGVDVEAVNNRVNWLAIAPASLTYRERHRIAGLPKAEAAGLALRLWVRKEAALKCTGFGMGVDMTEIDMLGIGVRGGWGSVVGSRVWVADLSTLDGYVGAVAGPTKLDRIDKRHLVGSELVAASRNYRRGRFPIS